MQSHLLGNDVTRSYDIRRCVDVDVYADTSPYATAISRKTNSQPNRQQQHRIFTSTPKYENKFNKQQQTKQRNDAINFFNLAKATKRQYIRVGAAATAVAGRGQGPTFDIRLKALLFFFGVTIIGYRIICLTMPYINGGNVQQLSSYVQAQLSAALEWSEEHQLRSKLSPLLCGLIVALFSYGLVYLDSAEPGVNPPAPFLSRSSRTRGRRSVWQLNYLCALGAGIMVTFLMYADL